MAAQSLASRSRRRPPGADPDDVVLARALEFTAWAQRNARILIVAAVLALVVVGGLIYYRIYQTGRAESAAADLMAIEQSVTAAADPSMAAADLQRFIARYDGTTYADEARLMLGRIHLQQGQVQEAAAALEPAAGRMRRSAVGGQAGLLLGAAHEQAGNPEAAERTYLRVGQEARFEFERREALEAAAAMREAAGNFAGAAELYRQLVGMAEQGSQQRAVYEMRAVEAEAQARVP